MFCFKVMSHIVVFVRRDCKQTLPQLDSLPNMACFTVNFCLNESCLFINVNDSSTKTFCSERNKSGMCC